MVSKGLVLNWELVGVCVAKILNFSEGANIRWKEEAEEGASLFWNSIPGSPFLFISNPARAPSWPFWVFGDPKNGFEIVLIWFILKYVRREETQNEEKEWQNEEIEGARPKEGKIRFWPNSIAEKGWRRRPSAKGNHTPPGRTPQHIVNSTK